MCGCSFPLREETAQIKQNRGSSRAVNEPSSSKPVCLSLHAAPQQSSGLQRGGAFRSPFLMQRMPIIRLADQNSLHEINKPNIYWFIVQRYKASQSSRKVRSASRQVFNRHCYVLHHHINLTNPNNTNAKKRRKLPKKTRTEISIGDSPRRGHHAVALPVRIRCRGRCRLALPCSSSSANLALQDQMAGVGNHE
uniref:Uncharacterized protein n=1 Tax=Arundo donax TaxID=35708 RepID=A0A0A9HN36_ARUDO